MILNIVFFCTIDLAYLSTFFGFKTGSQYAYELFLTSAEDSAKFHVAFRKRLGLTKAVHREVKDWVAENIQRWWSENEDWFKIEKIPDDFLPDAVVEAVDGAQRRRSRVSLR